MSTCAKCGHQNDQGARFCDQCAAPLAAAPIPAAAAPAAGKKKRILRIVAILVVIDVVVLLFFLLGGSSSSVQGEIRSTGLPHGDFVMTPPACHSGQHESFFGVLVASELETIGDATGVRGGLKLLKNPLGEWEAYLENPNTCRGFECQVLQVDRKRCLVFDVAVHNTGTMVNTITLREGHAHIECAFAEGGTLKVDLEFSGCD